MWGDPTIMMFHGQEVASLDHEVVLTSISAGSFTYKNLIGKTAWIQKLGVVTVSGAPVISVKVGSKLWTRQQVGTPTGISESETDVTVPGSFSFEAQNQEQEVELLSNETVAIGIASGTGTINIFLELAYGRDE